MTISCDICFKEFKYPYLLLRHKKRKTPCKNIENTNVDKNISESISKYIQIYPNISENISENISGIIDTNSNNILNNISNNNSENISSNNEIYFCKYCCKEFKHKSNLYRHKNELRCKRMPNYQIDIIKKNLNNKIVKQELINNGNINNGNINIQNNNIQNNITNNINIRPFGSENLDAIDNQEMFRILNRAYLSYPEILKTLHFDIKENRNIFQPNKNKPYVKVFDGKSWIYKKFDKVSEAIGDKINNLYEEWFRQNQHKFRPSKKKAIGELIEDYNEGKMEDRFNEEFKIFLMSYSTEIKEFMSNQIDQMLEF